MKRRIITVAAVFVAMYLGLAILPAAQAEESNPSVVWLPARSTFVDGNATRFQAVHWMKDGYTGGVEEFEYKKENANNVLLTMGGHAIADEDYKFELELEKENVGHAKVDFTEFTKYFDARGGAYKGFTTFVNPGLDRDMSLRIGKLETELAWLPEDLPHVVFLYEMAYKNGLKSRLTWTEAEEGTAGLTRNIVPVFLDIDETEHVFDLEVSHPIFGFDVTANEHWE